MFRRFGRTYAEIAVEQQVLVREGRNRDENADAQKKKCNLNRADHEQSSYQRFQRNPNLGARFAHKLERAVKPQRLDPEIIGVSAKTDASGDDTSRNRKRRSLRDYDVTGTFASQPGSY